MKTNRNLWPYGIIVTFALFFCGLAAVITIAVTHREYLVNDDYYEQEVGYQSRIDSTARARAVGATIIYDVAGARVIIGIPPGPPAQKYAGKIQLYRPSAPALDREIPLETRNDGTQIVDASKLADGPWKVQVTWQADGQKYYLDRKIVIAEK
jgi:hypothetical protein